MGQIEDLLASLPVAQSNPPDLGVPPPVAPPSPYDLAPPLPPLDLPSEPQAPPIPAGLPLGPPITSAQFSRADLGLPPASPIQSLPPLQAAPKPSKTETLALLLGALIGGPRATGLLQGVAQEQAASKAEFDKNQQLQQANWVKNVTWQAQQRQSQLAEEQKRGQLLVNNLTKLKTDLTKVTSETQADGLLTEYGQMLTGLGFPGFDANGLRAKGFLYHPPDAGAKADAYLNRILKNPETAASLAQNPDLFFAGTGTPDKTPGIPMTDIWRTAGRPFGADGKPLVSPMLNPAQQKSVLLDGKPAEVLFDTKTRKYFDANNQEIPNAATRIRPIPPASAAQGAVSDLGKPFTPFPIGSKGYNQASDLAFGRMTFSQFRTLYAYSRDATARGNIYAMAQSLNPNFNPAQFELGNKFAASSKNQQQVASLRNVENGVPDLLKFSDQATRMGATILNSAVIRGGIALGGKRYSNFAAARKAFADELSGALGYGTASDMKLAMGLDLTDPNLSPENFRSAITEVVIPFVQRKKATLLGPMGIYGPMSPGEQPGAPGNVTPPATPSPAQTGMLPGHIRARDPSGQLHDAPAGTPLPRGWTVEP